MQVFGGRSAVTGGGLAAVGEREPFQSLRTQAREDRGVETPQAVIRTSRGDDWVRQMREELRKSPELIFERTVLNLLELDRQLTIKKAWEQTAEYHHMTYGVPLRPYPLNFEN